MSKGKIRIIGGKWKGKKISFTLDKDIRPTPDKAKETLFNWLGQNLNQFSCLDLFAGTGAMGLESLSRNAEKVIFVEKNKYLVDGLIKTISELECEDDTEVFNQDCVKWLKSNSPKNPFDLIFVDPPFNKSYAKKVFDEIKRNNFLVENSIVYLECEKSLDVSFLEDSFTIFREKSYGEKSYRLLRKII